MWVGWRGGLVVGGGWGWGCGFGDALAEVVAGEEGPREAISYFFSCFPSLVCCFCFPWQEDIGVSEWVFDGFLYLRYRVLALK